MFEWLKNLFCGKEIADCRALKQEVSLLYLDKAGTERHLSACKEANEQLRELVPAETPPKPKWMNSDYAYVPRIDVEGETVSLTNPRDIYAVSASLEKIVKDKGLLGMGHDHKLVEIWKYVIHALSYKYDSADNWQFPIITIKRRYGDCEDGTILFVTLCKLANIPADKVFNCIGYYFDVYHSFPIAQMEDGKWYVFESTLNNYPNGPMLFEGSKYDAKGGVCNWEWFGGVNNESKQV